MSAKDLFHQSVVVAIEKDGWRITHDPFFIKFNDKEFHLALGQFLNYRLALKQVEPERILYLAIPKDTYEDFFSRQFIQNSVSEYQIKLMIFDSLNQEVVLWKE